ncbi:MAG: carboxypeptidase regulatory-like domain-containing protein [Gemmatimonadetes bacterium]|nr:MAG: carboxypeptidase regulatory-like domain-containing protein [Gemmatimonadota bacterium]
MTPAPPRPVVVFAVLTLGLAPAMAWAPSARAQGIRGQIVTEGTGAPVEGAAVVVFDGEGRRVAWRLTDESGRYTVALPGGGTYHLRAERIGHASTVSGPIVVPDRGVVPHRLEVPVEAIALRGLTVEAGRRCEVRPGEGEATARAWDEARKALEVARYTSAQAIYQFVVRTYQRRLDPRGRRILDEDRSVDRRWVAQPFVALPADTLVRDGYVRREGEELAYYAPDAEVLLSDAFLDTHCLRLRRGEGERAGYLGLEFEPVERDASRADIEGVFWLEEATARLDRLEFRYRNLPTPGGDRAVRGRAGGHVDFERMPGGTWIVRDWAIRMPVLERQRGILAVWDLAELAEAGGTVVRVRDRQGRLVLDGLAASLTGVVLDSLSARPIAGARVWLDDDTGAAAVTGPDGSFQFAGLPDGLFEVNVRVPSLDSLGFEPAPVRVRLEEGQADTLRLRLPGRAQVLVEACRDQAFPSGTGIILGYARDADTGRPLSEAVVQGMWDILRMNRGSGGRAGIQRPIRESGFYALCGIPLRRWVEVRVVLDGREGPARRVYLEPDHEVRYADVALIVDRAGGE